MKIKFHCPNLRPPVLLFCKLVKIPKNIIEKFFQLFATKGSPRAQPVDHPPLDPREQEEGSPPRRGARGPDRSDAVEPCTEGTRQPPPPPKE